MEDHERMREALAVALEGDGYTQGTGYLRRDGNFCCLGVASDLCDPSAWLKPAPGGRACFTYGVGREAVFMTAGVRDAYGFRTLEGSFLYSKKWIDSIAAIDPDVGRRLEERNTNIGTFDSLMDLNDSEVFSFKDIALIIRNPPPDLLSARATGEPM